MKAPRIDSPTTLPEVAPGLIPDERFTTAAPKGAFEGTNEFGKLAQETAKAGDQYERASQEVARQSHVLKLDQLNEQLMGQIVNAHGADSMATFSTAQDTLKNGTQELLKSVKDPALKKQLKEAAGLHWEQLQSVGQNHLNGEIPAMDKQQTAEHLDYLQNAALKNYRDPDFIKSTADQIDKTLLEYGQRPYNNHDSELIEKNQRDAKSILYGLVVKKYLEDGDGQGALKARQQWGGEINPDRVKQLDAEIHQGVLSQKSGDLWDSTWSRLKLADGTPDDARIEKSINGMQGLSPDDKATMTKYAKAQAGQARTQMHEQDKARWESFTNQALTGQDKGATLKDLWPLAAKYAKDATDQADKQDYLQKLFEPKKGPNNSGAKEALWESVEMGRATKDDLKNALDKGTISAKDYDALQKQWFNVNINGVGKDQIVWRQAREMAQDHFGNDPVKVSAFMDDLRDSNKGQPADSILKSAKDKLDLNKTVPDKFLFFFRRPSGEVADEAQKQAFNVLNTTVGRDEIAAIGQGLAYKGVKNPGLKDIQGFAQAFGGVENIQRGTPVNNAMKSILRHNVGNPDPVQVTPDNIGAVLAQFPNGIY